MMPSGINAAFGGGNSTPEKRGNICGLTQGSARRCKAFLMSVDQTRLHGIPINITLTLRDCPPTSDEWDRLKKGFFRKLAKMGLIRLHHVTEWTKRRLPHLHVMAFFEPYYETRLNISGKWQRYRTPISELAIKEEWLAVASCYGAGMAGQHTRRESKISSKWMQYLSKHASRGAGHYQRQRDQVPEGWQKTGRMWGKMGQDWPVHSEKHELENWAYHHLRRQVRRLCRSKACTQAKIARLTGNQVQLKGAMSTLRYLKSLKRVTKPSRSATMPLSEWVDMDDQMTLLAGIHGNIEPRPDVDYRRRNLDTGRFDLAFASPPWALRGPTPALSQH